jgi:hypothetical protein
MMTSKTPISIQTLCSISTRGRYDTTLAMAIQSVICQSIVPAELIIFDDNDEPTNLTTIQHYEYLFRMLEFKGIKWRVLYGERKGQHFNHQRANRMAVELGYKFVLRLDDDTVAEPNVLETLLSYMKDGVGAVGGSILTPPFQPFVEATGKIEFIKVEPSLQWGIIENVKSVDHLHCSYLYRAGVQEFDLRLSRVAHREESLHSFGIKKKGFDVLIVPNSITWHLRNRAGGIRTGSQQMFEHDEAIFDKELAIYGVNTESSRAVVLNCGLGDHWAARHILSRLKEKYKIITIYCCYPEVFEDDDVIIRSIKDAEDAYGDLTRFNIYAFMGDINHRGNLVEAFEKMYLK